MNEEIKEIFRRMNDLIEHQFDKEYHTECDLFKDIQNLLDYITNLQQENENTKKLKERYQLEKEIYKSRCEKAIELYKNCKEEDYCILSLNMYEVLNGSDENE